MDKFNEYLLGEINQNKHCSRIFIFLPTSSEPNIVPLVEVLLRNFQVFTPIFTQVRWMISEIVPHMEFVCVKNGILQPKATDRVFLNLTSAGFEKDDVCLIPGVIFSKKLQRLGHGGGTYDRFLKGTEALKIGVCFENQIAEEIPQNGNDQTVDLIITTNLTTVGQSN